MTKTRWLIAGAVAAIIVAMAACAPPPTAGGGPDPKLVQGSWTLVWWSDSGPLPTEPITMQVEDARISGNVCNNYNGPVEINDSTFRVGLLATTMMLCAEDLDQAERTYHFLLSSINGWSIENGKLSLTTGGIEHLRFEKAS